MSNPIINETISTKTIPQSKLMWTGAVITVLGFFSPKLHDWLNTNSLLVDQVVMVGGGFLVMLLRRFTTQPVQGFIKKD